ncbi:RICIN domain-containing protein [Streptomyces vietnamensis]|nr:RICIN domain-containing protein [Streptomyces vietnamensis]
MNSGKLVDVSGASTSAGARLVQAADTNAGIQLWKVANVD